LVFKEKMVWQEAGLFLIGLAGLWFISTYVVEAAKRISFKAGISEIFIGLTIASIGTSLPEIFISVLSGWERRAYGLETSGLALGNIIGSHVAQITLILGIVGMVAVLHFTKEEFIKNGLVMLAVIPVLFLLSWNGLQWWEGIIMVGLYIGYVAYLIRGEKIFEKVKNNKGKKNHIIIDVFIVLVGLVLITGAAKLLVENGIFLGKVIGLTPYIIGLFTGLSTSFPEMTVAIRAATKKAGRLSLGNLIGSNITDPLFSLGLGTMFAGFSVAKDVLFFDIIYWFVVSAIAFFILWNHRNLNKKEAAILISLYILFIYLKLFLL